MKANNYNDYRWTTSRSHYNKLRKYHLAHCSYCKWNKGENFRGTYYSSDEDDKGVLKLSNWQDGKLVKYQQVIYRRPNWKLASKNDKQWMDWTWQGNVNGGNREFSRISKNKRYK